MKILRFVFAIIVIAFSSARAEVPAFYSLKVNAGGMVLGPTNLSTFIQTNGIASTIALASVSNAWFNSAAFGLTVANTNTFIQMGAWYTDIAPTLVSMTNNSAAYDQAVLNGINATNRCSIIEALEAGWNKGVADALNATNRCLILENKSTQWDSNTTMTVYLSNQVDILNANIPTWNTAVVDSSSATNTISLWTPMAVGWNKATNDATSATNSSALVAARTNAYEIAVTRALAWNTWAGDNTNRLATTATFSRYAARSTSGSEILVCASGTGIVAAVSGNVITMTIPSGVTMTSCRIRWPASFGSSSFVLDLGTSDMANTGWANRWMGLFQAYREDTGAWQATATASFDTSNPSKINVNGLITSGSVVNNCSFQF